MCLHFRMCLRASVPAFISFSTQLGEHQELVGKLTELQHKLAAAQRGRDAQRAADIQYYAIPDVERRLVCVSYQTLQKQQLAAGFYTRSHARFICRNGLNFCQSVAYARARRRRVRACLLAPRMHSAAQILR